MTDNNSIINIAVVGGGPYCKELIEKTTMDYREREVHARMKAVADPDPRSPGMLAAKKLGLITVSDYHELYDPKYNIRLFILTTPEQEILDDILRTKPPQARLQSYHVFDVFWKAISIEERKLRKRNEEVETILNGIQDLICVISPDMDILEINDAFTTHTGYSREEALGKKCYSILRNMDSPCNPDECACPLREVVKYKRPVRQIMTAKTQNKNPPRYYEVNMFPIYGKDSRILEFIEISRDITLQLKEEEEITRRLEQMVEERTRQLKETHEKLLHQDKMVSLGKLAASVVHEINNPIAGVLNLTMLMKKIIRHGALPQRDVENFKNYLDLMETETRRTSGIVSNLLTFSRQTRLETGQIDHKGSADQPLLMNISPVGININSLVEQTLLLNSNLLKIKGIKIERRFDPLLPDIVGSPDQLLQVFMNLISNAVEAMEPREGGILTIETGQSPKHDNISILFVDSGTGIAKENINRIFEPFFTTKRKKGVGLGLSVASGIIQEHGGSINVRSRLGEGTTFRVELPLKNMPVYPDSNGGTNEQR
jgi:two-component system NtrC family sensor kinase